jgi:hypothetical protein
MKAKGKSKSKEGHNELLTGATSIGLIDRLILGYGTLFIASKEVNSPAQ